MEQPALSRPLLEDRYRLEQVRGERQLPNDRVVMLWRAADLALGRRVGVLIVTGRTKKERREIAAAATRASRITDGRCVRILDVGEAALDDVPATFVVTEWVDGPSLGAVLRREPLRPPVAVELARQCADVLAEAEREGCHHGRLHPDELLLPPGGLPRLTGVELNAAIAGTSPTSRDDVRGVGALLFAALTGRWPLPGWSGLPAPGPGATASPRALRGTVPRDVDAVVVRALGGGYDDVAAVARALGRLPAEALDAPPKAPPPGRSVIFRRWAWRVVPPLLVAVIATGAWAVGSDLGRVPGKARTHHASLPPAAPTAPGGTALRLVWRTPPAVTSFDPEGDGQENADSVGFAVDHDASTSWTTDRYQSSSHFGGLKDGVGLLIDLGRSKQVRAAQLALTAAGSTVELRAGDRAPAAATDLPLVASTSRAPADVTWSLKKPTTARYWLIWFTNLPKVSGGYRIGVTDVALMGSTNG